MQHQPRPVHVHPLHNHHPGRSRCIKPPPIHRAHAMRMQTYCHMPHLHVSAVAVQQQLAVPSERRVYGGCSAAKTPGCQHASLLLLSFTALYSNAPGWMMAAGTPPNAQYCCAPSNTQACLIVYLKRCTHAHTLSRMTYPPSCPTATPINQPHSMNALVVCMQALLLIVYIWLRALAHKSSQLQL